MPNRRTILRSAAALGLLSAAPMAFAGGHGRLGSFSGLKGHIASGRAEIAGNTITLLSDFRFDGAPDPKVALGLNGFDKSTILGPLKSDSGKQSYAVPQGIDPARYNEVWIWCEKFNVPLAMARIN